MKLVLSHRASQIKQMAIEGPFQPYEISNKRPGVAQGSHKTGQGQDGTDGEMIPAV